MQIIVKTLQGEGCMMNATDETTILEIKQHVESELNVPVYRQTLVLMGRTLTDDQTIGYYGRVQEGTKIHLIIKKKDTFQDVLGRFLLSYYTEKQAKIIVAQFMKDFESRTKNLSLDDMERIATSFVMDDDV